MINHIHLIISSGDKHSISDILRDFKKYTSLEIRRHFESMSLSYKQEKMLLKLYEAGRINSRNKDFQLWQNDNHAIEIYTEKFFEQKLNYIHMNLVKAGICSNACEYYYTNARYYMEHKGPIEIDFVRW